MMLNVLPWKRTKSILSFLRLHPSTTFQTLVDYDGYSISKGVLPTVVDKMVIIVFLIINYKFLLFTMIITQESLMAQ